MYVFFCVGADEKKAFVDLRDMVVGLCSELQELKADYGKSKEDQRGRESDEASAVADRLGRLESALGEVGAVRVFNDCRQLPCADSSCFRRRTSARVP